MNKSAPKRSALFTRSFQKTFPVAARAEGAWIWEEVGKRYLDFSGSAAVNFIGHGVKEVGEAMAEQAARLEFVHSSQFVTQAAQDFAEQVLEFAGGAFRGGAVYFTSGGSEAIETALKLARQYQVEIGEKSRYQVISRRQSYHGSTLGALAVSGNLRRREIYLPMVREFEHIGIPYCYRCDYDCKECSEKYVAELEQALQKNACQVAGFIFEPMSGATLGAATPPKDYLERVQGICQAQGVLMIADEVMTGCGRTGKNFAVEHWQCEPDIIVAAKGLSSGYAPLGVVVANKKVVDAIAGGSGAFVHGFTYNAHPVSVAAGAAVLKRIKSQRLVETANSESGAVGKAMKTELQKLREIKAVGDVRGVGLLWGVEFVAKRESKEPFRAAQNFVGKVAAAAMRKELLVYPIQGCVDGYKGDHVLLAPPAVITPKEIGAAVSQLAEAIEEAAAATR